MITNSVIMSEQHLSRASINSIISVLHDSLKTDLKLANDLLIFLKERNISIPAMAKQELNKLLPATFQKKNSGESLNHLKDSLDGIENNESIL